MMATWRELFLVHTTITRWVHEYAPKLKDKITKHLKKNTDSYRLDETYIKIKGTWQYLYRAVDLEGQTLDWLKRESR